MDLDGYCGYSKFNPRGDTRLLRQLVAEFLGTMFLVLIGCGSTISGWKEGDTSTIIRIAFAFGFSVAAAVEATGHVSGGHVNPAVTIAMLLVRKIQLLPGLLYIVFQTLGALSGAALLLALTPVDIQSTYGLNIIDNRLSIGQGFGVELLVTFILVLVIFVVTDEKRTNVTGTASVVIGSAVVVCHLFSIPYTGCGLNPARVFASAAITNEWANQWVYWLGECTGGLLAAFVYTLFFTIDEDNSYCNFYRIWCPRKVSPKTESSKPQHGSPSSLPSQSALVEERSPGEP